MACDQQGCIQGNRACFFLAEATAFGALEDPSLSGLTALGLACSVGNAPAIEEPCACLPHLLCFKTKYGRHSNLQRQVGWYVSGGVNVVGPGLTNNTRECVCTIYVRSCNFKVFASRKNMAEGVSNRLPF